MPGADTISYIVTDTITGTVTAETQTVTLSDGPAPVVTLAAAAAGGNGAATTLGTVTGFANDPLSVSLTADSTFAAGSSLALVNGALVYTPGPVTTANAGPDTISYTVADTVTGAATTETQAVTLDPGPLLAAGTLTIGHGATEDVTALVDSLIQPGLVGDTEQVTAVTGNAVLTDGSIVYTAPDTGETDAFASPSRTNTATRPPARLASPSKPAPSPARSAPPSISARPST
ncbi:MAG: hypothetical protein WDN49_23250 [Acetobacteraceae bacterium]